MKNKLVLEEVNRINFLMGYDLKKIISEQATKKVQVLEEGCVRSSVKIDPKTGKPGYFDTVTGKPCNPNASPGGVNPGVKSTLLTDMKKWNEKYPCVPKHQGAKQVKVKATVNYGPIAYDLKGFRYFDNGLKLTAKTKPVKFSCNDTIFKRAIVKGTRTPIEIANFLKQSDSWDDDEPGAEKAFSEIKTWERYNLVKKYLGQDPYKFVSKFIDVNEKYGNIQSITTSFKLIKKDVGPVITDSQFKKMCPVNVSAAKPAGPKQYLGNVNFMKFFKGGVGTPGADPLLYGNGWTGTYAKVPKDYGWSFNNSIYPYPKYYSQQCIDSADAMSKMESKNSLVKETEINEYIPSKDSETTAVNLPAKNLKGPSFLMYPNAYKNKKVMMDYNQSLSKQKELIPKYCKTPLERDDTYKQFGPGNAPITYNYRMISMYNLCRDYGGLWVYGVGTSKYVCGCRDNTNPALNIGLKTDTGTLNVSKSIQSQQGSTNWSNVDSRSVIWGVAAFASAFIPVVGPFVTAGIGLGGAADLWTSNKKKEAAIAAFFSVLPLIGKIPAVGRIGTSLAAELKAAVIGEGVLTEKQLETLLSIIKYDSEISDGIVKELEKKAMGKIEQHIVKTAVKKVEEKVVDLAGVPTYGDLKKKVIKTAINPVVSQV